MKDTKAKDKKNKKIILIAIAIIAAAGVGAGVYFGALAIYDSGVAEGRKLALAEVADKVQDLGKAISEKANFQKKISEVFNTPPETANTETIDDYLAKLDKLIEQTTEETVKTLLTDYKKQWQDFKETYASKDNDAIAEGFNALKTTATETATQIKTAYDAIIKQAIDNL